MSLAGLQAARYRLPERKRPAPLQQQHLAVGRVDYNQDGKRAAEIGLLHALPRLVSSRVVPHSQAAASFPVEALCWVAAVCPEGVPSLVEAPSPAEALSLVAGVFPGAALFLVEAPSPEGAPCPAGVLSLVEAPYPADTPSLAEALFPVVALYPAGVLSLAEAPYPADTLLAVGAPIPWGDAPLPGAPWRKRNPLPVTTGSGKAAPFPTRS